MLLTEVVDKVILLLVALLFCKIRFPVPVTPPDTVRRPAPELSIRVVPPDATVIAVVVIFNGDTPLSVI